MGHSNSAVQQVPFLIHQTWRDSEVPEKWRGFQASWLHHHPNWRYRLWTDLDLRQLICEHYPWFLPIYDNYPEQIQRVDAARYFLMHRYGGVYVDLDFECLRSLESLLSEKEVVLGYEPQEHFSKPVVRSDGLDHVLCNAFLASSPGHAFWEHVFLQMIGAHRQPGPLPSTGPLMLTRALQNFGNPESVTCLPSSTLYPGTSDEAKKGLLVDSEWRAQNASRAHAIHHWSGSWIKSAPSLSHSLAQRTWIPVTQMARGKLLLEGQCVLDLNQISDASKALGSHGYVSCLMVTSSERLPFAKRAIACFQSQTYPAKELVIIDDSPDDKLQQYIESLADSQINYVHLKDQNLTLGALRNRAVLHASGEYVMQWDDDDLYHPRRIETQMRVLEIFAADACLLSRWKIWWPTEKRLATAKKRAWEGSILCAKKKLPRYDETLRRGEDTPVVLRLASRAKLVFADAPWLYTYVVHGSNTTTQAQLEKHWPQASQFYWDKTYASGLAALARELPRKVRDEVMAHVQSSEIKETKQASVGPIRISRSARPEALPRILILSPVKDGQPFINRYIAGIQRLDYPPSRISLALLESDSADETFTQLTAQLEALKKRLNRVELFKRDYHFRPAGHRADSHVQLQRRSILARSRNYLLARALRDEDWVLWLDFDVIDYPADVIQLLLAKQKEIVVPHCVVAPGGRTFDLNTFIHTHRDANEQETTKDPSGGPIFQPLRGVGRIYLEEMRDRELVEVNAVGGTMLLVKADLHREGLFFPVSPYRNHIETEGLSFLARDMGISSWGAPQVEIVHANR